MRLRIAIVVALFVTASSTGQTPASFDVRMFGAKSDGKTLDSDSQWLADKRLPKFDKDAF